MTRKNKQINKSKIINKETVLIDQLFQKCIHYSTKSNQTSDELLDEFNDLSILVNKIRKYQEPLFNKIIPKIDRSIQINKFIDYCKQNNLFDINKIEFCIVDNELDQYGLKSLIDLKENDLLLRIPRKFMLTNEDALNDINFSSLIKEDSILRTMPNVCLSLFLIEEKCKESNSFWKIYLDTLPTKLNTILNYNSTELDLLKQSPSFEQSIKLFRNICRQYSYFYSKMINSLSKFNKLKCSKLFTFDLYRWAISIVMSRQNFIPSKNENQMIDALIPIYDMLNHENGKLSTDFDTKNDEAICYAMRDFKAGEEIKIYYGNRSNSDLLIYSGFVDQNNSNDYLIIKLGISKNDLLFNEKIQILDQLKITKSGSFKLKHKRNQIDGELLAFLRVFHLDKNELDYYLQSNQEVDNLFKVENERLKLIDNKIQEFLSTRAKLMLRNYSIVKEKQQKIPKTVNLLNILLLLSMEQKILESYLI